MMIQQKKYPVGRNGGVLYGRDSEQWKEVQQIKKIISEFEGKFWNRVLGYRIMVVRTKETKSGRWQ